MIFCRLSFRRLRPVLTAIAIISGFPSLHVTAVQAQPITPAIDGTGTLVSSPRDNQFNITGGTLAGTNLFQSFQQFGLTEGQIANFIANPNVQNILGRITGGDASLINGTIQVTGSNANLYLMNPAGIVFGANARLDVPGSFTATTATAIGFGNDQWFTASGTNSYARLSGNPGYFAFLGNPGSVVNAGQLNVTSGQSITLLGGTVINTGTIAAPGGTITIAAVSSEKMVHISQAGSLLSLALPLETRAIPTTALTPLSLPQLLTGGNVPAATGITLQNGMIRLTSAQAPIPLDPGTAIATGTLTTASPSASVSAIRVLGDRVGILSATVDASGRSGGSILVGGDYQGRGSIPTAVQTFVSADSQIRADAFEHGNGGRVIVWADGTTQFAGHVSARGGIQGGDGGFVEVSGGEVLAFRGTVDTAAPLGQTGTLLLDPTTLNIINGTTYTGGAGSLSNSIWEFGEDIGTQTIGTTNLQLLLGINNVTLQATDTINWLGTLDIDGIGTPGRSLTLQANGRINFAGSITDSVVGGDRLNLVLNSNADGIGAGSIQMTNASIFTGGGSITLGGGADPVTIPAIEDGPGLAGVRLVDTVLNSGGGAITIQGESFAGTPGLVAEGNSQILSGSGAIALTANEIDLNLAPGRIQGTGSLTLQPLATTGAIAVGNTTNVLSDFTLTTGDLAALANGFSEIVIGRADSSGTVTTQALAVNDPLTIRAPVGTGAIAMNGTVNTNNNPINLLANSTITVNSTITAGSSSATLNATAINLNAPITAASVNGNTATLVTITNSGIPATSGSIDNGVNVVAPGGTVNASAGIYVGSVTITKGLTLNGATTGTTVLSGGNTTRVLEVSGTGNVVLNRLSIQNGNIADSGGGIFHTGASALTINDSAIANNQVTGTFSRGGGIFKEGSGSLVLNRTTVIGNTSGTTGGGIYINNGSLTVTDSTIANNTASQAGGGIRSFSSDAIVNLTNTTLSGNRSGTSGGAFSNGGGIVTIRNSTIANNGADVNNSNTGNGGGISNAGGSFALENSIVAGNFDQSTTILHPDVSGTFLNLGYNLIGNGFGSTGLVHGSNGSLVGTNSTPINPLLAPLGSYGGSTPTHTLLPGSFAIDTGTPGLSTADQRGQLRLGRADIGAVESQGFTITPFSGTVQSTPITTTFATPLSVRVTANHPLEPVVGGIITFGAPTTGASGSFNGNSSVTIDQAGIAIAPPVTANDLPGTYAVAIPINGIILTPFTLTNVAITNIRNNANFSVITNSTPFQPVARTLNQNTTIPFAQVSREVQGQATTGEIIDSAIAVMELCLVEHDFLPLSPIEPDWTDCRDFELEDFVGAAIQ